jgi:DNA-binding NarL/FixJ family response regulator
MLDRPRNLAVGAGAAAPRTAPIRVAVLAAHRAVRDSLARVLAEDPAIAVAASVAGPDELALVGRVHVVVAEPDAAGVPEVVLQRLHAAARGASLVVLASAVDGELIRCAVALGMTGLLVEDSTGDELVESVRDAVHSSVGTLSGRRTPVPADERLQAAPVRVANGAAGGLTPRERDVLTALGSSRSSLEAASRLAISPHTLKTHVKRIMGKLGAHTRAEALATALRLGAVSPHLR